MLDKTWQEIYDAFPNVVVRTEDGYGKDAILSVYIDIDSREFVVVLRNEEYSTDNSDGYPLYRLD